MISVDELADLLNREADEEFMEAIQELWNDGDNPFDPEHPAIEAVLERIVESINEDYDAEENDYED